MRRLLAMRWWLALAFASVAGFTAFVAVAVTDAELGTVTRETIQASVVAGLAGAALGMVIAELIARRLRRIAEAARAIGEGDFDVVVRRSFPDEVGSLAESIERMRGQLQTLFGELEAKERAQREFATNAAHELRTPLASIVTAVELLQTGAVDDPPARDEFLQMIANEAERLTRLTRALLVLARAEAGERPPRREEIALAPLLRQVASRRREIDVECREGLTVTGDADLLEQALTSLVANAVEHAPDARVTLRAREPEPGSVLLEVADTGGGIAESDRERVFERFYRGSRREGGFGLGLSIARQAVRNLGGEIELDSRPGVGTTVRITL